jgi:hypothetical protein
MGINKEKHVPSDRLSRRDVYFEPQICLFLANFNLMNLFVWGLFFCYIQKSKFLKFISTTTNIRKNKISSYNCRADPNEAIYKEKIIKSFFLCG